jgi:hypothetical protein
MLIDLYDSNNKPIGEFGWGGFKLYPTYNGVKKKTAAGE